MICKNCDKEMILEEVLVSRTTSPEEEDRFEKAWVCTYCDNYEVYFEEE